MNSIIPSIMQSIKPQYCELIAAGKKTIEVRKTRPKLKPPFKVYIYCTKNGFYGLQSKSNPALKTNASGKVIGEYVCDRITPCVPVRTRRLWDYGISLEDEISCCLSHEQLWEYGKGKTLYGYHITNLKIYDEPKELSEFFVPCRNFIGKTIKCYSEYSAYELDPENPLCNGLKPLTRPPQSWCYVEEAV